MSNRSSVMWIDYNAELVGAPDESTVLKHLEYCGRTCYNSIDNITENSAALFIRTIIKNRHLSVLEHQQITAKVTMDRGLSHEWVRHRIAAYSQQSTRYYKHKNTVPCIMPQYFINCNDSTIKDKFISGCETACSAYLDMINNKVPPENARAVLPTCTATVLMATHNLREWRHIFQERLFNTRAHPDMRFLMKIVFDDMNSRYPTIFNDLVVAKEP